jgi:CRP-like cAMP-binding protein
VDGVVRPEPGRAAGARLVQGLDRLARTLGFRPNQVRGADYGYPRLATVVATTDLRLAKLTANTLRALMRDVPEIDARVREAATERLATS